MRQLVHTMFLSSNGPSFHLWWKESLVKHWEVSKYYETDCGLAFYGSGPARLLSWLGMVNAGSVPCDKKFPCKWNLVFFKAVPQSRLHFHRASLLNTISSSFSHFCLFQNAILHKMLKLGFWNFKPTFLRMQLSFVVTFFFSGFGCLSWYLHLKLSHEFLTFISSNISGWECKSIRSAHLELVTDTLEAKWLPKWLVWTQVQVQSWEL